MCPKVLSALSFSGLLSASDGYGNHKRGSSVSVEELLRGIHRRDVGLSLSPLSLLFSLLVRLAIVGFLGVLFLLPRVR